MLDFLLRYATPRNFVIAALLAASAAPAARLARYSYWRYQKALYPPVHAAPEEGGDIKQLLEKRESEKIEGRYRRVGGLILQAKADGFDVAALEDRANEALAYNVAGRREIAVQILNEVELAVPKKKVQYLPVYARVDENNMSDDEDTPRARPSVPAKPAVPNNASQRKRRR